MKCDLCILVIMLFLAVKMVKGLMMVFLEVELFALLMALVIYFYWLLFSLILLFWEKHERVYDMRFYEGRVWYFNYIDSIWRIILWKVLGRKWKIRPNRNSSTLLIFYKLLSNFKSLLKSMLSIQLLPISHTSWIIKDL